MTKLNSSCKCSACLGVAEADKEIGYPLRYTPSISLTLFNTALFLSVPIIGAFLIGIFPFILIPFLGFIMAYIVSALFLCSSCTYHHDQKKFCGCFPKSQFSYKRYKRWGVTENIIGWPLIGGLLFIPTLLILVWMSKITLGILFLFYILIVVCLQASISCPNCRQRSVCYLGMLSKHVRTSLY